jgi:hypothetical protein
MRKVNLFLSAVAIIAVLTLVQRFYLDQSDTGKAWSLMSKWFWLCDWLVRRPRLIHAQQSATAMVGKGCEPAL